MNRRQIREVCAWCPKIIRKGRRATMLSHGICKRCGRKLIREYERKHPKLVK
jgi:rRNA maturation endonuclease Nob1